VRDGLGWRPLPGARAEEGEPRWEGGGDALVWYTLWDNKAAAARFKKGLESAWAKRRSGGSPGRRSQIKQLLVSTVPVVRLVDAPAAWAGSKRVPTIRITRAAR